MIAFGARACSVLFGLLQGRRRHAYLIPANVCAVVPATLLLARCDFEPVDIDESTLEMDPDACLDLLRRQPSRFGGVLFVRPFGRERNADPFFRQIKELRPDLYLIDDKCLCRPDCDGSGVSTWADATLFSTGRVKHVDLGFGGFAHISGKRGEQLPTAVNSAPAAASSISTCLYKAVADKALELGPPEQWLDLKAPSISWSDYRERTLKGMRAADHLKSRLNAIYADVLPGEIQMPAEFQDWRFNILVPESDRLVNSLFEAGLFASRHYGSLAGPRAGRFPVAERLHREVVNLFNDRYFDESRAERAAHLVLQHLGR